MAEDDTQQNPFTRPGFIVGAVVVAALIVTAIVLTVLNLNRGNEAGPPAPEPSSSRRRTWSMVLRGTMTPGPPAAPSGAGVSARARRWPSVATARSRGTPASATVCRYRPFR